MVKRFWRGLLLLVAVALLALPTFAQTTDFFRVTAQSLNARTGPGIEYEIVARLGRGSSYTIVAYSPTRNWVLLDLGYTQAWAFSHLGVITSYGVGAPVVTGGTTTTTSTAVDPSLGQGGGFAPPIIMTTVTMPSVTETGVDLTVTSTQAEFNSTVGVTGTVRMRIAPTSNSRILRIIPYDQRATPVGRNAMGTWIQVEFEGTVGWVYFLYVAFPPAIDVVALPVTG